MLGGSEGRRGHLLGQAEESQPLLRVHGCRHWPQVGAPVQRLHWYPALPQTPHLHPTDTPSEECASSALTAPYTEVQVFLSQGSSHCWVPTLLP